MTPDANLIEKHLRFLIEGMNDYSDGRIEIAYGKTAPNQAENFSFQEINKAAEFAAKQNTANSNIYITGALLDPEIMPVGRSRDKDFYACNSVWCDIDSPIAPSVLKEKYKTLPPSMIIVTGRHPHIRTHLWWKLSEPITDSEQLREMLEGLQQHFSGDPKVKNVTSLMRLGGSIAWPKKEGRTTEKTEIVIPANASTSVSAEKILSTYKVNNFFIDQSKFEPIAEYKHNPISGEIVDGREQYMHQVLAGCIFNLTADKKRWPTADEVFQEAWPTYSRKIKPRTGRTLDQDGRGQKAMQQKIISKLRAFKGGYVRTAPTLESIIGGTRKENEANRGLYSSQDVRIQPNSPQKAYEENEYTTQNEIQQPRIEYTLIKDIKHNTESKDFVKGLLAENQLSVIYGESNCGKTFFMTDLCFHIATGRAWRNRRVDRGGIVYAALEGSYGLKNRVQAYRTTYGLDNASFALVASQIDFLSPEGNIGQFIDCIKRAADEMGSCKMVVIDTLSRALSGGDENSGQDMGMLVHHADKIRYETGAHISFVHHAGKNKALGARGHSSLRAAVDTEIEIYRDDGAAHSVVKVAKQREMEAIEDMYFSLEKVILGYTGIQEEISSCVVKEIDKDSIIKVNKSNNLNDIQQFVYDSICNAMIHIGKERMIVNGSAAVMSITYDQLGHKLEEMGFKEVFNAEGESKVKQITNTVRIALRKKNKIGFDRGYIWLLKSE